ncbi:phosphotransferase [Elysia marginata]|uniref:Phosphotransferase n=1 Tax=Elysia marginata TaxID=1093978 RepID=A0AAV4FUR4_9GAST|nr:phosphotransferase [Elysia marginata]
MSCAHSDRNCAVGLILGTGTNACYIEDLPSVKTWDGDYNDPKQFGEDYSDSKQVSTSEFSMCTLQFGEDYSDSKQWGAFGNDGCLDFICTDFDRSIDKHSINPGKQIYEKMISGMYMGEIARLAIERLRKHNLLFEGEGSYNLSSRGRFYTKYVSEIEGIDSLELFPGFSRERLI